MKRVALAGAMLVTAVAAQGADPTKSPVNGYPDFAIGSDMSWTKYIQDNSLYTYYPSSTATSAGVSSSYTASALAQMTADYGIDAVRLRVWVDPTQSIVSSATSNSNNKVTAFRYTATADGTTDRYMSSTMGYGTQADLLTLATQFANAGLRVMVTFQLSDTWTDPGAQFMPNAWTDAADINALAAYAADHVTTVLTALHDANVNVAWVQIGNETNAGMLKYCLPATGGASTTTTVTEHALSCRIPFGTSSTLAGTVDASTARFVTVWHACADAAHSVYPQAKTVLHLTKTPLGWSDNANGKYQIPYVLTQLKVNGFGFGTKCQVVGLSCYPTLENSDPDATAGWSSGWTNCLSVMQNIYSEFGVPTIVAETGMNSNYSTSNSSGSSYSKSVSQCDTDVKAFTQQLFSDLKDGYDTYHCLGAFYWEPECSNIFSYKMGACHQKSTSSWPSANTSGCYWDQVVPNPWWDVCKANSTFPAGGLQDYETEEPATPEPATYYLANAENDWVLDESCRFSTTDGETYFLTGFSMSTKWNLKVVTENWSVQYGGGVAMPVPGTVTLTAGSDVNLWRGGEIKPEYAIIWRPATCQLEIAYAHLTGMDGDWSLTDDRLMQAVAPGVYRGSGVSGSNATSDACCFVLNSDWDYKYGGGLQLGATNPLTLTYNCWLASDIEPQQAITADFNELTVAVEETNNVFTLVTGKTKDALADNELLDVDGTIVAKQLVMTDGYPYAADREIAADALRYLRGFTAAQTAAWQSLFVPFDIPKANWDFIATDDGKYCVLDYVGDILDASGDRVVEMQYVEDLETNNDVLLANHPYFFMPAASLADSDLDLSLTGVTVTPAAYSWQSDGGVLILKGSYQPVLMNEADADGYRRYALANGEFRFTTKSTYLKPFRAYMVDSSSTAPASIRMRISDSDATGIEDVDCVTPAAGVMYDMYGRRVTAPVSGLYILDGRKVFIR